MNKIISSCVDSSIFEPDLSLEHVVIRFPDMKIVMMPDLTTQFSGLPGMPTNLAPANPRNPFVDYTVSRMYEFLSVYELLDPTVPLP